MKTVFGSSVVLVSSSATWSPVYLALPSSLDALPPAPPALTLSQAALVGAATVVAKNPETTRRFWGGKK